LRRLDRRDDCLLGLERKRPGHRTDRDIFPAVSGNRSYLCAFERWDCIVLGESPCLRSRNQRLRQCDATGSLQFARQFVGGECELQQSDVHCRFLRGRVRTQFCFVRWSCGDHLHSGRSPHNQKLRMGMP
jgi:hypothetical protein